MTHVETDEQADFVRDRHLEDPELEQALQDLLEYQDEAKDYRKLRKWVKSTIEGHEFPAGTRVVVGRFVIEMRHRAGGNIHIPFWEKTTIGKISEPGID